MGFHAAGTGAAGGRTILLRSDEDHPIKDAPRGSLRAAPDRAFPVPEYHPIRLEEQTARPLRGIGSESSRLAAPSARLSLRPPLGLLGGLGLATA